MFQAAFLADLADEWLTSGKGVLKIVAKEHPEKFMQACVALMPKSVELDTRGPLSEMSDDDLQAMLDHVRSQRAKLIEEKPAIIEQ